MKTLTLLRHFKYDQDKNIPAAVAKESAPLLAQVFTMRSQPYPDIARRLKRFAADLDVAEVPLDDGETRSFNRVSLSHGLGIVDMIASSSVPRAIQTADALCSYLPVAKRLPDQAWADENYTGDKYRSFHARNLESGACKIDYDDFSAFANFLATIPPEANHVVLVSHLPAIRALAIAAMGGGDIGELSRMEHTVRDHGNGNPERFGFMLSMQAEQWTGFSQGGAVARDRIQGSKAYQNLAYSFHLADKTHRKAPDSAENLNSFSLDEERSLALRPYNPPSLA